MPAVTATQVCNTTSPVMINQITHVYVFRLRNITELNALSGEFSALYEPIVQTKLYKDTTQ